MIILSWALLKKMESWGKKVIFEVIFKVKMHNSCQSIISETSQNISGVLMLNWEF